MATKKSKTTARTATTQSVYEEILKNHGAQAGTVASGNQNTSQGKTKALYDSILSSAQKREKEKAQQQEKEQLQKQTTRQRLYMDQYNNLVKKTTGGKYNASQVESEADKLIGLHKDFFSDDSGKDMLSGLEEIKKTARRSTSSSGILSEEAEEMRKQREAWQSRLSEIDEDTLNQRLDAVTRNRKPDDFERDPEYQEIIKAFQEAEDLREKTAALDVQLNRYDRTDGLRETRVESLKNQKGFSTARETYAAGEEQREQENARHRDKNRNSLQQVQEEINALTYNKSPAEYQSDPEYQTLISQMEELEKAIKADNSDELGDYLDWYNNLDADTQDRLLEGRYNAQNPKNRETVRSAPSTMNKHWERMTEDEVNAYYYIANTEGMEAAKEFLDDLQLTLDQRHTEGREQATAEQMGESPVWANMLRGVATVGANIVGGPMAFVSDAVRTVKGEDFNPYSNGHYLQNITGVTRSEAANDIQQTIAGNGKSKFWNGVGELAANAYQSALSSMDSIAGMYTMGNAYTISMGMGAASSRMRELYESGATDEEIYKGAIGSGILEALFEKVSMDTLAENFIKANPEKWVKKLLAQAGVEGSEEFFTEISNLVLDAVNRGVNSDHNQRVRELMGDTENPMSREEAEQQAAKEDAVDVFWAFLGGVMSGGMSSVGGAAMDSSRQNLSGQDLLARNVQEKIIAEAQELRPGDTLAQDLEGKQKAGTLGKNEGILKDIKDRRDTTRLGRLLEQNVADMTAKDKEAVRTAVEARLKESGSKVLNPERTADAITKSLAGESLGVTDRFLLASNEKVADKIRNEIYSAADGTTADNAWVKRIETYSRVPGTSTRETNVEKAGREAMETTVKEEFGQYSELILGMYRSTQNRSDFVAEAKEMYQAGMDGVPLDQAPKTQTLEEWQRAAAWDMGQGKSDYAYDNNQGFATVKGETTPVNIVGVESAGNGSLTLRTDEGETVDAKDVTFGSYSQSKLYSVISAMGVDTETANQVIIMSKETGLDLNTFSRAVQDAFYAGRNGVPFADIPKDRYAMKLTKEQRKLAWQAGRAAARERAVKKGKRVQQGKHGRARGGVKLEASARNIQNLNAQQQAGMNAANVLGAMGLDITVYASTEEQRAKGMENGHIQLSDGSIHIDLNAGDSGEGVMAWALSHEFTHFVEEMSPEKFQTFQEVLFQELGQNGQDVMELIEDKVAVLSGQQHYSELSEDRLWEIATSEVVAEMMEIMLTDTDAIARISDNLRQQDKGLWEKIKDWLSGLVEKLKNAYKDLTPGSAIAQQTRSIVAQSEEILNAWVDVATDAVVNYNLQDGQKNNTPGGVQFSTRNVNGENIVWIEDSGLTNKQLRDHQTVANYIAQHVGEMYTILESGMKVYLGENLPGEYTHSRYTSYLQKKNKSILKAKNKAVDGLGEMIEIASNRRWEATRHQTSKDAKYGMYRYDSKFAFPIKDSSGKNVDVRAYDVELLIRNASDGKKYLYDIVNIKENTANVLGLRQRETRKGNASVAAQSGAFMNSIHPDSQNVNQEDTLFSSRNVQQTKNLVALHNITEDKFLKTLELGGFPMPSIAITKADIPHTNFGDITVVFGRETIDPKANRKNTVYSADAWTPTVPQVEYEADSKATSRIYKRLSGLRNQVDEYFRRDLGYATYDLENALNRYGGEEGVVQAALDNYGVKAAYLEEQGKHIQPVTRQKQVSAAITPEVEDKYLKIMQVLGITSPEEISGLILKDIRNQHGEELEKIWPGVTKTALRLSNTLKKIQGYLLGIGTEAEYKTVTDVAATKEAVDSAIDKTEFEEWVRNLYQGVEKSSGVYNGKPRFTEAGNSRTFKQTHLPATLEGIVKAMAAQNGGNTKNVSGFNGVKTLRAGTAERFSSIADMHKMEGRLQNLTQVQQDEIHDSLSTRLYDVIKAIDEEAGSKLGGSNSLVRYDTIGEVLMEIAESGSYNVADIQRVFQQYGKSISDETAMAAKELLFDISQMPVNIFEAKPERAVGFEEIKTVLVPDTASQKLLQELDSRGIPYQTYQAGNEEQRHHMVQDMEDIRFSQRSAAQFSRREFDSEAKRFSDEIERWDSEGRDQGQSFILGSTGEILQGLGAIESDIYMNGDKITTIMQEHPEITLQEIKQIPQILNDPVLILKSRNVGRTGQNTRMPLFGSVKGTNGQPVMAVFDLRPTESHFVINDMQKVTSAYTKTTDAVRFVQSSYVMYADKKRATSLLRSIGFQMPIELLQSGFTGSITYRQRSVNLYGENFSDVFVEGTDTLYSQRSVAQLERENEQLRRDKEYLKELVKIQRTGNKDVVPTRASVNSMAEALKKQNGVRGNTGELAQLLEAFYRYMGKGNLDYTEMDRLVGKAADWIQEHQTARRDPYAQEVLDWMKKRHVSLSQTQVDEIKYQYGSLREFQSAIKGSIIIDQKANTSLDQLWQEGASQFADQFDTDMNEGDMPGAFADLVERLKNSDSTETAEAKYYQPENYQDLMDQVYDTYFNIKPIDSISDKMQEKIDKLKTEREADRKAYREELGRLKAEKQGQKTENMATLKAMQGIRKAAVESYRKQQSASDQRMKQLYEQQYRLVMDDYQRQLETMEGSEKTQAKVEGWRKTEERGKLQRTLTTLNKMMLNPTKTAFVPDSLQPAVIKAMEAMNNYRLSEEIDIGKIQELRNELDKLLLDGATKNQKRIRAINNQLDKLQGDYGSVQDSLTELKRMYAELMDSNEGKVAQVYDEGVEGFIADAMEAIGNTEYSDLSVKQLQALNDAYAAILHRVRTANNTFAFEQKEAIDQLAKTAAGDFRRLPDRESLSGEIVESLEKFGWNNLKPGYAFERLGSATMTTLYNNLRKGEDVFYQDVVGARAWALECMKKFNYGKWSDQMIEYESVDGKKFSLNLEERMSLYAYSRRRQAIEHLMKGGIVLNENTKRVVKNALGIKTEKIFHDYNNYRLSLDTIQAIGESLTKEQRAFAEKMQEYLSTVCADKNNEISRALYGVSKAKEKYYWPLKVSSLFSERVRNQQQNVSNRQKNAGHMKATTPHANNPVEIAGFMETWGNHVNNTAMYHAFTLPMEDFMRVYNFNSTAGATDESIVQLITKKHGKAATDYIDQFLKDLNQGVRADPRESIASSLTSKFKKGAVSASLSVAIQQPSAVGRAFAVIDPKYFSMADLRYYATSTVKQEAAEKQWEKVKKYAPVAGIKEMGRFDVNMGRSTVDFITGAGKTGFMAKLDEISGYLPEKMDQATWLIIWNAAERQCKAQGFTGEELSAAAGKLFTEAITKTQVYDSVFSRSGNMRSKGPYMNMATSFMAEPTTTANMFMSAVADIRNGDRQSGKRKISSIAAATVLNAILASFIYAARDDDEDKSYREKYLKSLTSELIDSVNPMGYVPIVKDIWSLFQGYDVDRSDMTLWSETAKAMKRLVSAYKNMAGLDEYDSDYEQKLSEAKNKVAEGWANAAGAVCNMFGLPVKNVLRDVRAVFYNTPVTVAQGRDADWTTTKQAMWEGLTENLPDLIRPEDSKSKELYKAMKSGSQLWIQRMRDSYSSDKAYENAVRESLRDYDKRIRQAARALNNNSDSAEYKRILQEILSEGKFTEEQVTKAIQAEATAIRGAFSGYSAKTVEKFVDLYEDNLLDAEAYTAFLAYRDAEDSDGKKIHHKDEMIVYIGSMKVNVKAKDTLYKQMGYPEKELEKMPWHKAGYSLWEARVDSPELADYSDSAVEKYLEIRNGQITAAVFAKAYEYRNARDNDGKQLHSQEEIMSYIDSLRISQENKDELYLAMGYKESGLDKTPWN